MDNMKEILISFAIKYDGDFDSIYNALKNKEIIHPKEIKNYLSQVKNNVVTILDNDYPMSFKSDNRPPFVLFYEGDLKLMDMDLPSKKFNNGVTRFFSTVSPTSTGRNIQLDYFIGCENQKELEPMIKNMKSKQLRFKNYAQKERSHER